MLTKRNSNLPRWNFKHNNDLRFTEFPKISIIKFMIDGLRSCAQDPLHEPWRLKPTIYQVLLRMLCTAARAQECSEMS